METGKWRDLDFCSWFFSWSTSTSHHHCWLVRHTQTSCYLADIAGLFYLSLVLFLNLPISVFSCFFTFPFFPWVYLLREPSCLLLIVFVIQTSKPSCRMFQQIFWVALGLLDMVWRWPTTLILHVSLCCNSRKKHT